MKKRFLFIPLFLLMSFCKLFAGDSWIDIGRNAKVDTTVYYPSKDLNYSLEEAIRFLLFISTTYDSDEVYDYSIEFYDKKDLITSDDFSDDYIYGTAVMASVELKYGIVSAFYFRSDDEEESIVGWDVLFIISLDDGKVLCAKIIEN